MCHLTASHGPLQWLLGNLFKGKILPRNHLSFPFFQLPNTPSTGASYSIKILRCHTATRGLTSWNFILQPIAIMATNPSMAPGTPDDENGIAVQVRSDYIPNPEEKAKNVLQVTRGELGWAFKSSLQTPTGWIICQIGVGKAEEQKVGKNRPQPSFSWMIHDN